MSLGSLHCMYESLCYLLWLVLIPGRGGSDYWLGARFVWGSQKPDSWRKNLPFWIVISTREKISVSDAYIADNQHGTDFNESTCSLKIQHIVHIYIYNNNDKNNFENWNQNVLQFRMPLVLSYFVSTDMTPLLNTRVKREPTMPV